ncbi:MAG: hypothetical protein QOG77_970 [Solirubrobacteraceae bacterium]|jgi:uncharacterized protein YndB with AHSA1/START domain|nr:hypothetical protein [Solirubrobacteraceae bacterium]
MHRFDDHAVSDAPVEEVWKLLYDPSRFPEWWQGLDAVERGAHEERGDYTARLDGHPDVPVPQELRSDVSAGNVTVSCLHSDITFAWHLTPLDDGGTEITVQVEVPDDVAHLVAQQRDEMRGSLLALARLAGATA